jgi:P2 family phage contractile tail tube protein
MAQTEKFLNANIYLDDNNHLGKALEVEVPKITEKVSEHQTLGMIGPVELFQGIEKMEMKIKWAALHKDLLSNLSPTSANKLTVRAAQHVYENSSVVGTKSVRCTVVGRVKEIAPSAMKPGEGDVETTFAVDYYKKTIDGVDVVEVDIPNYIYKVNGEDIYASIRDALGI